MITALYASVLAIWICWLVINVVKARLKNQVAHGDGGVDTLVVARSAHSNATETIPIALILLFALELNGGPNALLHVFGLALVFGRFLHAKGILSNTLKYRKLGMQITLFSILLLAVANFIFLPFDKLFAL
ncbi:MAPEG family protein [Marinomonas sp.]